jgi:alginate O-acetyltransferase complex protein AlgI
VDNFLGLDNHYNKNLLSAQADPTQIEEEPMVFSSILFLFLFLPVVITLYYLLFLPALLGRQRTGTRLGNLLLLGSSLFFYAWGEQLLVLVMMSSTLIDYACGLVISGGWKRGGAVKTLEREGRRTPVQKAALVVSICANLSILGFFKYFNFGVDNLSALADLAGVDWLKWEDVFRVTLPLGISFYTFQSMSYTIDVYRGRTRATRDLIDFTCFVTLFPQLVAGPIVRYRDIAAQLVHRVVTRESFSYGVNRFILGLGKKVLIANTLARPADAIFQIPHGQLTPGLAWLGVSCYTLQIYFDFSGYSDMAIGLGRMFGFRFLENFDYPYIARSVRDFWRRWHISLSRWFRDYLYIPLGGSRVPPHRIYVNLAVVFLLCGFWHGASWTFVVWGLFHGAFLVLERLGLEKWISRRWTPLRHVYVMLVVMGGWVLFRSDTFSQAMTFFSAMAGWSYGSGQSHYVALYLRPDVLLALLAGAVLSAPVVPWARRKFTEYAASKQGAAALLVESAGAFGGLVILGCIFFACAMYLSSGTYNPFIYFRF